MADNIRVLNNTADIIHVAVAIDGNNPGGAVQNGSYYQINANGGQEVWTRSVRGATAFVIRGKGAVPAQHGVQPDAYFVTSGRILVID